MTEELAAKGQASGVCPSEFPRLCSSGRHLPARTPWSPLVSAALAPCSSRNRHRSRRRWPPSSSPSPQSEAAECAELQVRAQGERLQPRRAEPIALRCVHALSSDRADQGPERVVSWSGRCRGSTLRLPLPRPALRRGPALALLLRVHAHAPVAVYSVRGSLELCARRRAPPTSVASVAVWAGAGPLARRYGHSRHLRCEAALRAHRWRLSAGQLRRRGPAREWRTTGGEQA